MTSATLGDTNETVVLAPQGTVPSPKRPATCSPAVICDGTAPGLTDETSSLLRRRLKSACWMLSGGIGIFLIYRLVFLAELQTTLQWVAFGSHALTTLLVVFIGWRLSCQCALVHHHVRTTELIVFGICTVFFGLVTFDALVRAASHGFVASFSPMWMMIIFTYALFIPNTWQRAAIVIGVMAAIPLALLAIVEIRSPSLAHLVTEDSYLKQGAIDHSLAILLSAIIGTWGVYTINSLRREAFEARRLGQYQLRHQLGTGGMGEVYLAEHVLLKRPCAIKLIRPDRAGDPTNLARFEREVRATARLTHWNSVEIFDYGHTADGTFYYVMEYLPGMNLDELVRRHGPLPADRIVRLITQTCDALREAHQQGLIHRDIKPANIFAAQRGGIYDVAKLLDFGLAKPTSAPDDLDLTQVGSITGSPHYMAPEQALGESPDERSDIYSLGAVAWYLAVGRPIFSDSNLMRVLLAHAQETPPSPRQFRPDFPLELEAIILNCLAKRPNDRPQSVEELRARLLSVPHGQGWTDADAARWWSDHGCPHKRQLDACVQAGELWKISA